ncbi:MAG: hypothetical protein F4164_11060 [Gemmatimonadales bacterium]|nr:hypothetical protein [Gemmatimonadales bacterium]MYG49875.1 hypothetical protein [Gemmatimonadales bacterium]MYK02999.1 hypothetical protein [Candidatus Palauibacter ramosifaciens]
MLVTVLLAGQALGPSPLRAQDPPLPVAAPDSAVAETSLVADTTIRRPPISPLGAFGRSLILPGWGQLEVGRPARGAFYFAAESVFLFMVFKSDARLSAAKEELPLNEERISNRSGQRENWIVLAGFFAFLSGLDAWVSTQFWDFEPSIGPPADGSIGLALGFEVDFP